MSSARGNRGGRGTFMLAQNPTARQPRPGFQTRGRGDGSGARGSARGSGRTSAVVRGAPRGRALGVPRSKTPTPSNQNVAESDPQQRFQALKKRREDERKVAIKQGVLADPDRPRTLAEAITPVGTCPDMCPEYERLERIVQKDVWQNETNGNGIADEGRMVKKFRRAAAGLDEQMPSDLRPPATLQKTCEYLFDDLIGSAESLATVHHFVWDRTRAIRNDFSIQQITKSADVAIAIECYERIARFHILSLHQFAVPEKPYDKYDWFQEREQLDRTLLSLMQYYDDNRNRVDCKNEPEFRAYCIVFQIQDPTPDLEERVNCWHEKVKSHPRVQTALQLYASACNTQDSQGPLKPRAVHLVAREDWNGFFALVESYQVSYLSACVAEIYFNMVRKLALNSIWRAFRKGNTDVTDFTLDYLTDLLRFDDQEQTRDFCEHFSFGFKEGPTGEEFLDLNAVQGKVFPEASQGLNNQIFCYNVVESKRAGRTFPAIIRGLGFAAAQEQGMVVAEDEIEQDQDMSMDGDVEDGDSLFVPNGPSHAKGRQFSTTPTPSVFSPFAPPATSTLGGSSAAANPSKPAASPFTFGKPSNNNEDAVKPATNEPTKPTSSPFSVGKPSDTNGPGTKPLNEDEPKLGSGPFSFGKPSNANDAGSNLINGIASPAETKPGSTSSPKLALGDSIFAPKAGGGSTFSSWGKPSTSSSPWTQPVSTSNDTTSKTDSKPSFSWGQPSATSTENTKKEEAAKPSFSWGQPSTSSATQPSTTQATSTHSATPGMTSIHAPTSFSWGKPSSSPSPWSQPIIPSSTKSPGKEQTHPITPSATTSTWGTGSVFSQPSTEMTGKSPMFSFSSPLGHEHSGDDQQSSSFKPSGITIQPSLSPTNVTDGISKSSTVLFTQEKPLEKEDASIGQPIFNFATPKAAAPTQASGPPTSSFPSSTRMSTPPRPAEIERANTQNHSTTPEAPVPKQQSFASAAAPTNKAPSFNYSSPSQPRKPSPLSQSFSAPTQIDQTDGTTFSRQDQPPKPLPTFGTQQSGSRTVQPMTKTTARSESQSQATSPDQILQRLAKEVMLDPDNGLMKQFVEYHARSVIMSVFDELYMENIRTMADNFRRETLAVRYGRRWRDVAWRLRLARQAREKRGKRRTARRDREVLETKKKEQQKVDAVDDFLQSQAFRSSLSSVNNLPRSISSGTISINGTATPRQSANRHHKETTNEANQQPSDLRDSYRTSMNRVDQAGRVSKPAATPSAASVKSTRSTFLGFSLQGSKLGSAARPSARSSYFRMKALGINPNGPTLPTPNLKKRARDDDESDVAEASPAAKKSRTPPRTTDLSSYNRTRSQSIQSQSSVLELSPAPQSVTSNRVLSHAEQADESLLARARAARRGLAESASWYRTQRQNAEQVQNVPIAAPVAASDSLQRARVEARLRASQQAQINMPGQRVPDVPAYRLRESRFVPREQYTRAIETARERVASRSRPQSVLGTYSAASSPQLEPAQVQQSLPHDRSSPTPSTAATRSLSQRKSSASPAPVLAVQSFSQTESSANPAAILATQSLPQKKSTTDPHSEIVPQQPETSSPASANANQNFSNTLGRSQEDDQPSTVTSFLEPQQTLDTNFEPAAWSFPSLPTETAPISTIQAQGQPSNHTHTPEEPPATSSRDQESVRFSFATPWTRDEPDHYAADPDAGSNSQEQPQSAFEVPANNDSAPSTLVQPQLSELVAMNDAFAQYPDLSHIQQDQMDLMPDDQAITTVAAQDDAYTFQDAAREALGMDSSFATRPGEETHFSDSFEQHRETFELEEMQNVDGGPIDPALLAETTGPAILDEAGTDEPVADAVPGPIKANIKSVATANPFAALVNGTDEEEEDEDEDEDEVSEEDSFDGVDDAMGEQSDRDEDGVSADETQERSAIPMQLQAGSNQQVDRDEGEDDDMANNNEDSSSSEESEPTTTINGLRGGAASTPHQEPADNDSEEEDASEAEDGVEDYEEEDAQEDGYDDDEDDEEEEDGEGESEEEYESEDDEEFHAQRPSRGLTPNQLVESGLVKGGTGTTAEDAFELSD